MAPEIPASAMPRTTVGGRRATSERLAAQEFHLVLVNTVAAVTAFSLNKPTVRIGKAPENDVVLEDPTVSRAHLLVQRQGDRFLVQDLGSTNGTFLDGAQVREAYLRPGAILEVGDVRLRFQPEVAPVEIAPTSEERLGDMAGKSLPMRQIFALLKRIAPTDSTLLLIGETGTRKGAAAKLIHKLSPRTAGPLVIFDCASVSDSLIESELFGHEKGAFTGAVAQRIGCLDGAHGGARGGCLRRDSVTRRNRRSGDGPAAEVVAGDRGPRISPIGSIRRPRFFRCAHRSGLQEGLVGGDPSRAVS